jgi:hypothetical protein
MIIVSHRGNLDGPDLTQENSPAYIDKAIRVGFDVEIDLRCIDNELYLGHDYPNHHINLSWLYDRRDRLWIHCKDLRAASIINECGAFRFFCHVSDPFSLIHPYYLWVHDISLITDYTSCIVPLISMDDINSFKHKDRVAGICTDYTNKLKGIYL